MKTLFIYTDGSSIPNPGLSGYGIHMVIGEPAEKKSNTIQSKYKLTDRGYDNKANFKLRPIKQEYNVIEIKELYGYKDDLITNNQAEVYAIIKALQEVPKLLLKYEDIKEVVILSDSTYALGYSKKILDKKLDIEDVNTNRSLIIDLHAQIKMCPLDIRLEKVPAHADNIGNNRADMLANMGRMLRRFYDVPVMEEQHTDDINFWKEPDIDTDVFFGKMLFFFTNLEPKPKTYYMLDYKEIADLGKKLPEITYSLIKLQQPSDIVETVINTLNTVTQFKDNKVIPTKRESITASYVPIVIYLNVLLNKKILKDVLRYGDRYLYTDLIVTGRERYIRTLTVVNEVIAREIYPQVLSKKTEMNFEVLESIYENRPEENSKELDHEICIYDITDEIYTKNKKGKTIINPEFKNDKFKIKIKHKDMDVILYPKYDLPPRNTLKRFETKEPRVIVYIKDFKMFFEYFTYISHKGGELMLANYYANKIIKR